MSIDLQQEWQRNQKIWEAVLEFYNTKKTDLVTITHSQYSILALDWIFEKPVFKSTDFVDSSGIPAPTARRILTAFRDNNIIKTLEESAGRKSAVYGFAELINIVEGKKIF